MDSKVLKEYIYENNKIKFVLEKLGMHTLDETDKYVSGAFPDGDNPKGCLVYKSKYLNITSYTRTIKNENGFRPDIINLVMFIKTLGVGESICWICDILGINKYQNTKKKEKTELGNIFDFYRKLNIKSIENYKSPPYFDVSILDNYDKELHIDLIRKDFILPDFADKYQLRFDTKSNRIIFPHFAHDDITKILALVGRTVNPAFKELKIPKYLTILGEGYEKTNNLYGLSHNIENIKKYKKVLVFEAEKSVIKADILGYPFGVSVGCHEISETQVKLLIALGVEIIIAFDKDVSLEHIKKMCDKFKNFREVTFIYDEENFLNEKDAPVDKGKLIFDYLYRIRKKVER